MRLSSDRRHQYGTNHKIDASSSANLSAAERVCQCIWNKLCSVTGRVICSWITNTPLKNGQSRLNGCELFTQEELFVFLEEWLGYSKGHFLWGLRYGDLVRKMSGAMNKWGLTSGVLSMTERMVKMEWEGPRIGTNQICSCSQYCCFQRERRLCRGCKHWLSSTIVTILM